MKPTAYTGVLNKALEGKEYVAGDYSIADMAIVGWARGHEKQGIDLDEFPHAKRWYEALNARPAVIKGIEVGQEERAKMNLATDKDAQSVLFNQRAN